MCFGNRVQDEIITDILAIEQDLIQKSLIRVRQQISEQRRILASHCEPCASGAVSSGETRSGSDGSDVNGHKFEEKNDPTDSVSSIEVTHDLFLYFMMFRGLPMTCRIILS